MGVTQLKSKQLYNNQPFCALSLNADQAMSAGGSVKVLFDTEEEDTFGMYNTDLSKLLALYKLGIGSSANQVDSGNGLTGTDTDVTFGAYGKYGQGARYNGSSSVSDFGDVLDLASGDWTIAVNVKINRSGANNIVSKTNATSGVYDRQYVLQTNSSGYARIYMGNTVGGTWLEAIGNVNIVDGEWHTIIVSYDESETTLYLYVDDMTTPEATVNSTSGTRDTDSPSHLLFGASWSDTGATNFAEIDLTDVSFFNTIISQEMREMINEKDYFAGVYIPESGLYLITSALSLQSSTNPDFYRPYIGYFKTSDSTTNTIDRKIVYDYAGVNFRYFGFSAVAKLNQGDSIYLIGRQSSGAGLYINSETAMEIVRIADNI